MDSPPQPGKASPSMPKTPAATTSPMSKRMASKMGDRMKSEHGQSKTSQMSQAPSSRRGPGQPGPPRMLSRRIFLILAIAGGVVLLGAIIGLAMLLARKTPSQTVYDKACKKEHPKLADNCLLGSQPLHNCSVKGRCTRFVYKANRHQANPQIWQFYDASDDNNAGVNAKNLLCGTRDSLGVCSVEGDRDRFNSRRDELFRNAAWEDNCDQPNPCWDTMEPFEQKTVTREDCRTGSTSKCVAGMHAVVWMQRWPGQDDT